jgi:hypothetical protein
MIKKLNKISIVFISSFEVIVKKMSSCGRTKMQVFNSIIGNLVVKVVNDLSFLKVSTKFPFHYKSMFANISVLCSKWVFGTMNVDVTVYNNFTTPPMRVIRPRNGVASPFTIFSIFIVRSKLFFTFKTSFNHCLL